MKVGLRKLGLRCVVTFFSKVCDRHWYTECEIFAQNRRTCTAHQGDEQLRILQILGISEMRWTGSGTMSSEGVIVLHSDGLKHDRGVGVLLSGEASGSLLGGRRSATG